MDIKATISNTDNDDFIHNLYTVSLKGEQIELRVTVDEAMKEDAEALRVFIIAKIDQFRSAVENIL